MNITMFIPYKRVYFYDKCLKQLDSGEKEE